MPLFNKEFSRTEFDRKVRENPMNDKEPEPVVPAWEQKKKVKGFDLHPDVSMADRHTFNLRENEVETVSKKERFRRNIMPPIEKVIAMIALNVNNRMYN